MVEFSESRVIITRLREQFVSDGLIKLGKSLRLVGGVLSQMNFVSESVSKVNFHIFALDCKTYLRKPSIYPHMILI